MAAAAAALGREPKRVFLRSEAADRSLRRAPSISILFARSSRSCLHQACRAIASSWGVAPFALEAEEKPCARIDRVIVTKNSGGSAHLPNFLAARALGVPVVMVARPQQASGRPEPTRPRHGFSLSSSESLLHQGTLAPREV